MTPEEPFIMVEESSFEQEVKLLCSHAKLDRDKGYLALTATIKNKQAEQTTTTTTFPTFEHSLLAYLTHPATDAWEDTFGHIEACKVLIERQTYTQEFPTQVLAHGLTYLEHDEFRVRVTAGELLGKLCSTVSVSVIGILLAAVILNFWLLWFFTNDL